MQHFNIVEQKGLAQLSKHAQLYKHATSELFSQQRIKDLQPDGRGLHQQQANKQNPETNLL